MASPSTSCEGPRTRYYMLAMQNTKLTPAQIAWARSHDWFLGELDGSVLVQDQWTEQLNGMPTLMQRQIWFDSFRKLREWAGY